VAVPERTEEFTVDDRLVTDVGGTLGARVRSTPGMIAPHGEPRQAVPEPPGA
jgi:hypothetical protein